MHQSLQCQSSKRSWPAGRRAGLQDAEARDRRGKEDTSAEGESAHTTNVAKAHPSLGMDGTFSSAPPFGACVSPLPQPNGLRMPTGACFSSFLVPPSGGSRVSLPESSDSIHTDMLCKIQRRPAKRPRGESSVADVTADVPCVHWHAPISLLCCGFPSPGRLSRWLAAALLGLA